MFVFVPVFLLGQTPIKPASIAITHITVIDTVNGSARSDMTVLIGGNRIIAVEDSSTFALPRDTLEVNSRGKFLIPGLWDMHVHVFDTDQARTGNSSDYFFPLLIANGVLGIRDMASDSEDIQVARRWNAEIEAGTLLAPRVMVSSQVLDGDPPLAFQPRVVRNAEEAREAVRALKSSGAGFIKVYARLSRDAYFAIADEAKQQRIPFAGHVPATVTAAEASDAGQQTIEHMIGIAPACTNTEAGLSYDAAKCAALADRFRRNSTWLVPTAVVFWRPAGVDPNPRRRYAPPRGVGAGDQQPPTLNLDPAGTPDFWQAMRQVGRFLAGTDLSIRRPWLLPGFSLHDELALFVERGYSVVEALQAATLNAAKYRGADDSGVVEAGKRADLVLFDSDPLADIRNSTTINAVILNGRLLDRTRLDQLLAEGEAAASRQKPPPAQPMVTFIITAAGNTAREFVGTWESDFVGAVTVELVVNGNQLTGRINGGAGPTEIFEGRIDSNTMIFKVNAGLRMITFTGTVTGNEIEFTRHVEVLPGGTLGGQGLVGGRGALRFSARRLK